MIRKLHLSLILSSFIVLSACSQFAGRTTSSDGVPDTVRQLVDWETGANAAIVGERSSETFDLYHYEIPLHMLEKDFAEGLDPRVRDSFVFRKDGIDYVRWLVNPEDTKWHLQVAEFLQNHGLEAELKTVLKGHLTASRSLIAYNPENGVSFSVKVSTNQTGGNWKDKKQTWDDAKQIRKISDWIDEVTKSMRTDTLIIMDEPLAMGIGELDQGLIVRSLNNVPTGDVYYLPGFSALHSAEGRRIAELAGATNIAEYWNENYNKPLAKALAEFSAYTGVYYDSPHSQNFMIELDQNFKPTGKIVLRDFGDAYVLDEFVKNTDFKGVAEIWERDNVSHMKFKTAVGLLHGNAHPDWINSNTYKQWGEDFYKEYERLFSEISGVPESELKAVGMGSNGSFSYHYKHYQTNSAAWLRYIEYANCLSGRTKTVAQKECLELFKARHLGQSSCFSISNSLLGN